MPESADAVGENRPVELHTRCEPTPEHGQSALNDEEVLFGFYPVVEREVAIDGKEMPIFDAVGDTVLFHHSVTDNDRVAGSQYVDQARSWFESVWGTISRTHTP